MGYLYIIQLKEHIDTNSNIYKIGRASNIENRFSSYPKGSKLIYYKECKNDVICEKKLINLCNDKYNIQHNIGTEYYYCENYNNLIFDIDDIIKHENMYFSDYKNKIEYKCNDCGKLCDDLTNYKRHMNRKNKCNVVLEHKCIVCDKKFNKKANLNRHLLKIHKKNIDSNQILHIDEQLYTILFYGTENIDYIKNTNIEDIINSRKILDLIKLKHFNIDHRENFNFHLLDKIRYKYMVIKKDNNPIVDWDIEEFDVFLYILLFDTITFLNKYINDNKLNNSLFIYDVYKTDLNLFNNFKTDIIKLSVKYMDLIISAKKLDNENQKKIISQKTQSETLITPSHPLPTPPVKRGRGRPKKSNSPVDTAKN
jgi:hypothetical protein